MKEILNKVEASFKAATRGEETVHNVIWWWGAIGYLSAYFIIDYVVKTSDLYSVDVMVSLLAIVYFSWHIYVLKKCSPKKPKLSKKEKEILKAEARKDRGKRIMRKLFLQESITKWDPIFVTMVIDLFCIANFVDCIFR